MISVHVELWVLQYIVSKPLKFKVNPNRIFTDGNPFWLDFNISSIIKTKIYISNPILEENFSQPLNINAQNCNGRTFLHLADVIPDDFLALNPEYTIKEKGGLVALDYRKKMRRTCESLEKYIALNYKSKDDIIKNLQIEKDTANKKIAELEAKYAQLLEIISH